MGCGCGAVAPVQAQSGGGKKKTRKVVKKVKKGGDANAVLPQMDGGKKKTKPKKK